MHSVSSAACRESNCIQPDVQCLVALNADMDEEWKICLAIANSNAKNYQLWNHRRKCALRMGPMNAEREMEFASSCLELDAKNYHIWAHRQVLKFLPYSNRLTCIHDMPAHNTGGDSHRVSSP